MSLKVYDCVYAHFAAFAEACRVKDGCARGNEHFVLDRAAHDMRIRANEAIVPDAQRVMHRTPEDCVLHDDALAPDRDRAALGYDLSSIHDSAVRPYRDVAA